MALNRMFRLSDSREIQRVFRSGRSINTDLFQIRFVFANGGHSKFNIAARAKVFKNAVTRNKIKRRVSEIIRTNIPKIKPGFLVSVTIKEKALALDYEDLKNNLLSSLSKIRG